MPLINGIEVYNTLKKQGRSVPTIIITGSSSEHSKDLALFDDIVLTGILNKPFDPNLHEAVSQQVSQDVPEGHVMQQMRKGYRFRDRLIRPAMVVVAKQS